MNDTNSLSSRSGEKVQVLVVGAGPAGCTTAALLAQCGLDVLLVDKAQFPREKTCGDGLTPRSVAVLKQMGLLAKVEQNGAMRVRGARIVAPNGQQIEVGFDELEDKYPPFGLTIPRKKLDALLLEHAQESGARFLCGFHVKEWIEQQGSIIGARGVMGDKQINIHAPLTCLATGVALPLVKAAGMLPAVPPLIQAARAYFSGAVGLDPVFQLIFDRALLPGYGWIFPLDGERANIGAGTFQERCSARPSVPPRHLFDSFVEGNTRVRQLLSNLKMEGPVRGYPLRTDFLTAQTERDGLLLVGESAGLVNPINGEGVDYALESGMLAARVVIDAVKAQDFTRRQLEGYGLQLREQYHLFFYYLTRMRKWYIRERVMNTILNKAQFKTNLKILFVNAALGLIDPRDAVSWRTLWDILF